MVKCKISEVISLQKSDTDNPVLAHFQNGKILPDGAKDLDGLMATDTRNGKRVAIAASGDTVYSGYINDGFATNLMRTFVGIRNKQTNKVRLVEVNQCSLMSNIYDVPDEKSTINSQRSAQENLKIMFKNFGGKKAIRAMDRKEKMKLNLDVVKDQLDRTVETVQTLNESKHDVTDEFDKKKAEQEQYLQSMVPQVNKEAKVLSDVYKLSDIIEQSLIDRLEEEALSILKTPVEKIPFETNYLLDIIAKVQLSIEPDSQQNLDRIKTCIYVDALINFLTGINRNRNMKILSFSKITEKVESDIRKKFAQLDGINLIKTNYTVHKLICYIIVLSLLLSDNYEIDMDHMVDGTKTAKSNLLKLINVIPVRQKAGTKRLVLRLPGQLKAVAGNFNPRRRK